RGASAGTRSGDVSAARAGERGCVSAPRIVARTARRCRRMVRLLGTEVRAAVILRRPGGRGRGGGGVPASGSPSLGEQVGDAEVGRPAVEVGVIEPPGLDADDAEDVAP